MNCPGPADLVELAIRDGCQRGRPLIAAHVRSCAFCTAQVRSLRDTAAELRRGATSGAAGARRCLTHEEIASTADGAGGDDGGERLAHLASCEACRGRLAALLRLVADDSVIVELARLEAPAGGAARGRPTRPYLAAAAVLAAAVLAAVLVRPQTALTPPGTDPDGSRLHRESAITTTVAPRVLGPAGPAAAADSLVWTSVPHADRYRVRIFERDGTLRWDEQTSDTTLAMPAHLIDAGPNAYLWQVQARTGWDRWVASDWHDLVTLKAAEDR
jgi:hypothetical protein